jgi:hypothetical protein
MDYRPQADFTGLIRDAEIRVQLGTGPTLTSIIPHLPAIEVASAYRMGWFRTT